MIRQRTQELRRQQGNLKRQSRLVLINLGIKVRLRDRLDNLTYWDRFLTKLWWISSCQRESAAKSKTICKSKKLGQISYIKKEFQSSSKIKGIKHKNLVVHSKSMAKILKSHQQDILKTRVTTVESGNFQIVRFITSLGPLI